MRIAVRAMLGVFVAVLGVSALQAQAHSLTRESQAGLKARLYVW